MKCTVKQCDKEAIMLFKHLDFAEDSSESFCYDHCLGFARKMLTGFSPHDAGMKNLGLVSIKTAANILNVHPETLRRWDNSGKLKAVRLGSRRDRRYSLDSIRGLM